MTDKVYLQELSVLWDETHDLAMLAAKLQHKIMLLRERNDDNEELEVALDTINNAIGDPDGLQNGLTELAAAVDFDELHLAETEVIT